MSDITFYNGRARTCGFAENNKGRAWILENIPTCFDQGRAFTINKDQVRDLAFLAEQDGLEVEIR